MYFISTRQNGTGYFTPRFYDAFLPSNIIARASTLKYDPAEYDSVDAGVCTSLPFLRAWNKE